MSYQPFAHLESLRIGTVDFVSPDEVKVLLDTEAPETVALNAGGVRPFPRVNGYVLLPVEDAYLVGQIEWLTIERSNFFKRGCKDSELIDLPYPLRKMSVAPLGTLRRQIRKKEGITEERYEFRRGSDALPSLGSSVLLPTESQLRAIVESGDNKRVKIGTSPMAGNAEVKVDPDRLFGRHLAVLGNTGSGKSCSVAGLVRWSLEAAKAERGDGHPSARFIILDPNGEYAKAFKDDAGLKARIFKVGGSDGAMPLIVPLWFWNSAEWCSFTQASTKTQRPTLIQALRHVRSGDPVPSENLGHEIRRFLRTIISVIRIEKHTGTPWGSFPKPKSFFEKLEKWRISLLPELPHLSGTESTNLKAFVDEVESLCAPRRIPYAHMDFMKPEIDRLLDLASTAHVTFGGSIEDCDISDADAPKSFKGEEFLRGIEAVSEMLNYSEYVETLLIRIKSLLKDIRMAEVFKDGCNITLEQWLQNTIGSNEQQDVSLSVLDLSLLPAETIHVVTAVVARMILEALQRYRKLYGNALPTVLVMEEAHTFVKRYKEDAENQDAASLCCQVFERIAREGRKFGLGLVLSSQRPSELSPTVLSQCNTFLLHRISNDKDQELVHRLVPDNLRGLLRELPSLPSQHAILLGWASELPVLVKMQDLPANHRPHSDDPHFWNVWTGAENRPLDWKAVADDWQECTPEVPPSPIPNELPTIQSGESPVGAPISCTPESPP